MSVPKGISKGLLFPSFKIPLLPKTPGRSPRENRLSGKFQALDNQIGSKISSSYWSFAEGTFMVDGVPPHSQGIWFGGCEVSSFAESSGFTSVAAVKSSFDARPRVSPPWRLALFCLVSKPDALFHAPNRADSTL